MIIGICGNGYCGSSAVTDYLSDSDNISVSPYDIEFTFIYDVDGIDDLRHHIVERPVRFFSSDAAIKRFRRYIHSINSPHSAIRALCGDKLQKITDEYLSSVIQLSWNGWWHFDVYNADFWTKNLVFRIRARVCRFLKKTFGYTICINPKSKMCLSVNPAYFDEVTRQYVARLVEMLNPLKQATVVLDQPFPVGKEDIYRYYFSDDLKTITVIRDPRDVYLAAKMVNAEYASWIPTDTVQNFITYFKLICADCLTTETDALVIRFEDLIYNYEETADLIDSFVGESNSRKRTKFNPDRSISNTQLFLKYPQYIDDILQIETELKDYLYNFPEHTNELKGKISF